MRRWAVLALVAALPAGAGCGSSSPASSGDAGLSAGGDAGLDAGPLPQGDGAAGPGARDAGGAFTPAQLAGLALWLDDDKGVVPDPQQPGHVLRWLDQSGDSNDATAMNAPEPTIDPKVLNGHDALVMGCNASPFQVTDAPPLDWGTGDFTITAVVKVTGDGAAIWHDPSAAAYMSLTTTGDSYELTIGADVVSLVIPHPGSFDIVTARGRPMRLESGGTSALGPATSADVSPGPQGVFVGFCTGSSQMEIAELVAIGGPLSDDDLARLTAYLRTKFAL